MHASQFMLAEVEQLVSSSLSRENLSERVSLRWYHEARRVVGTIHAAGKALELCCVYEEPVPLCNSLQRFRSAVRKAVLKVGASADCSSYRLLSVRDHMTGARSAQR